MQTAPAFEANEPSQIQLSGLCVQPIAERIQSLCDQAKLDEDDLDRALTTDGRALLDHAIAPDDWIPIQDVEGLVELVAGPLGGEAGLVEWAPQAVDAWCESGVFDALFAASASLIDREGFVVSQVSEWLVRSPAWSYDGGRWAFSVRIDGLAEAPPLIKAWCGGVLARLAARASEVEFDVRIGGIDADALVIFGERPGGEMASGEFPDDRVMDSGDASRLHRAALIP